MNNICENFKQIIINSMEDIKNLKNKTIQKSDNSFFSKIITSVLKDTVNNNATGIIPFKNYFYCFKIIQINFFKKKI